MSSTIGVRHQQTRWFPPPLGRLGAAPVVAVEAAAGVIGQGAEDRLAEVKQMASRGVEKARDFGVAFVGEVEEDEDDEEEEEEEEEDEEEEEERGEGEGRVEGEEDRGVRRTCRLVPPVCAGEGVEGGNSSWRGDKRAARTGKEAASSSGTEEDSVKLSEGMLDEEGERRGANVEDGGPSSSVAHPIRRPRRPCSMVLDPVRSDLIRSLSAVGGRLGGAEAERTSFGRSTPPPLADLDEKPRPLPPLHSQQRARPVAIVDPSCEGPRRRLSAPAVAGSPPPRPGGTAPLLAGAPLRHRRCSCHGAGAVGARSPRPAIDPPNLPPRRHGGAWASRDVTTTSDPDVEVLVVVKEEARRGGGGREREDAASGGGGVGGGRGVSVALEEGGCAGGGAVVVEGRTREGAKRRRRDEEEEEECDDEEEVDEVEEELGTGRAHPGDLGGREIRSVERKNHRKRSCSSSTTASSSAVSTSSASASSQRRRHKHRKRRRRRRRSRAAESDDDEEVGGASDGVDQNPTPRVNPIFVWAKQDDAATILEVLCEDYDKRNRIRLTKTPNGWRAIPRTERFAAATANPQATPSSNCVNPPAPKDVTPKVEGPPDPSVLLRLPLATTVNTPTRRKSRGGHQEEKNSRSKAAKVVLLRCGRQEESKPREGLDSPGQPETYGAEGPGRPCSTPEEKGSTKTSEPQETPDAKATSSKPGPIKPRDQRLTNRKGRRAPVKRGKQRSRKPPLRKIAATPVLPTQKEEEEEAPEAESEEAQKDVAEDSKKESELEHPPPHYSTRVATRGGPRSRRKSTRVTRSAVRSRTSRSKSNLTQRNAKSADCLPPIQPSPTHANKVIKEKEEEDTKEIVNEENKIEDDEMRELEETENGTVEEEKEKLVGEEEEESREGGEEKDETSEENGVKEELSKEKLMEDEEEREIEGDKEEEEIVGGKDEEVEREKEVPEDPASELEEAVTDKETPERDYELEEDVGLEEGEGTVEATGKEGEGEEVEAKMEEVGEDAAMEDSGEEIVAIKEVSEDGVMEEESAELEQPQECIDEDAEDVELVNETEEITENEITSTGVIEGEEVGDESEVIPLEGDVSGDFVVEGLNDEETEGVPREDTEEGDAAMEGEAEDVPAVEDAESAVVEEEGEAEEESSTVGEEPAAVEEEAGTIEDESSPVGEEAGTVEDESATVEEATSPVEEAVGNDEEEESPVEEETVNAEEEVGTAEEEAACIEEEAGTVEGEVVPPEGENEATDSEFTVPTGESAEPEEEVPEPEAEESPAVVVERVEVEGATEEEEAEEDDEEEDDEDDEEEEEEEDEDEEEESPPKTPPPAHAASIPSLHHSQPSSNAPDDGQEEPADLSTPKRRGDEVDDIPPFKKVRRSHVTGMPPSTRITTCPRTMLPTKELRVPKVDGSIPLPAHSVEMNTHPAHSVERTTHPAHSVEMTTHPAHSVEMTTLPNVQPNPEEKPVETKIPQKDPLDLVFAGCKGAKTSQETSEGKEQWRNVSSSVPSTSKSHDSKAEATSDWGENLTIEPPIKKIKVEVEEEEEPVNGLIEPNIPAEDSHQITLKKLLSSKDTSPNSGLAASVGLVVPKPKVEMAFPADVNEGVGKSFSRSRLLELLTSPDAHKASPPPSRSTPVQRTPSPANSVVNSKTPTPQPQPSVKIEPRSEETEGNCEEGKSGLEFKRLKDLLGRRSAAKLAMKPVAVENPTTMALKKIVNSSETTLTRLPTPEAQQPISLSTQRSPSVSSSRTEPVRVPQPAVRSHKQSKNSSPSAFPHNQSSSRRSSSREVNASPRIDSSLGADQDVATAAAAAALHNMLWLPYLGQLEMAVNTGNRELLATLGNAMFGPPPPVSPSSQSAPSPRALSHFPTPPPPQNPPFVHGSPFLHPSSLPPSAIADYKSRVELSQTLNLWQDIMAANASSAFNSTHQELLGQEPLERNGGANGIIGCQRQETNISSHAQERQSPRFPHNGRKPSPVSTPLSPAHSPSSDFLRYINAGVFPTTGMSNARTQQLPQNNSNNNNYGVRYNGGHNSSAIHHSNKHSFHDQKLSNSRQPTPSQIYRNIEVSSTQLQQTLSQAAVVRPQKSPSKSLPSGLDQNKNSVRWQPVSSPSRETIKAPASSPVVTSSSRQKPVVTCRSLLNLLSNPRSDGTDPTPMENTADEPSSGGRLDQHCHGHLLAALARPSVSQSEKRTIDSSRLPPAPSALRPQVIGLDPESECLQSSRYPGPLTGMSHTLLPSGVVAQPMDLSGRGGGKSAKREERVLELESFRGQEVTATLSAAGGGTHPHLWHPLFGRRPVTPGAGGQLLSMETDSEVDEPCNYLDEEQGISSIDAGKSIMFCSLTMTADFWQTHPVPSDALSFKSDQKVPTMYSKV